MRPSSAPATVVISVSGERRQWIEKPHEESWTFGQRSHFAGAALGSAWALGQFVSAMAGDAYQWSRGTAGSPSVWLQPYPVRAGAASAAISSRPAIRTRSGSDRAFIFS